MVKSHYIFKDIFVATSIRNNISAVKLIVFNLIVLYLLKLLIISESFSLPVTRLQTLFQIDISINVVSFIK